MGSKPLIALAGACAELVLGGCLGDDSDEEMTSEGESYALEVERISDDLDRGGGKPLAALNRLADGKAGGAEVAGLLDRLARDAESSKRELEDLAPPEAAQAVRGRPRLRVRRHRAVPADRGHGRARHRAPLLDRGGGRSQPGAAPARLPERLFGALARCALACGPGRVTAVRSRL